MPTLHAPSSIGRTADDARRAVWRAGDSIHAARFALRVTINQAVKACEWDGMDVREISVKLGLSRRRVRRELRSSYACLESGDGVDLNSRAVAMNWIGV